MRPGHTCSGSPRNQNSTIYRNLWLGTTDTCVLTRACGVRRSIISPVNAFFGAIGGTIGLLLMLLTTLNAAFVLLFGNQCGMCTPMSAKAGGGKQTSQDHV